MTPGPLHILAAAQPTDDPVTLALEVLEALVSNPGERAAVGEAIDDGFRWSPPLLAVGRVAQAGGRAITDLWSAALDESWIEDLAVRLGRFPSVGILSMGAGTTAVLSAADAAGRIPAQGFVASRAVARALAFLDITLRHHPPEEATAMLVPTLGAVGSTVFVAESHAERIGAAAHQRAALLAVVHPLARMDVDLADRYEPPAGVVALRL